MVDQLSYSLNSFKGGDLEDYIGEYYRDEKGGILGSMPSPNGDARVKKPVHLSRVAY